MYVIIVSRGEESEDGLLEGEGSIGRGLVKLTIGRKAVGRPVPN